MADIEFAKSYTLTNIIAPKETVDTVWNTGLCSCGSRHIDESLNNLGKATISDTTELYPKIDHNQVSVAIYGNKNQYIVLNPGEKVTVNADTDEAAQFYLAQAVAGVLEVKNA